MTKKILTDLDNTGRTITTGTITATVAGNLTNPLLTRIDSVQEGGQINFARSTDGLQYWYIDTYGSTSTPDLRIIENSTERFRFGAGGIIYVNGSAGTSGQVLTSNGPSSAASWTTVSGGGGLGYIGNYQTTSSTTTTGTVTLAGGTVSSGNGLNWALTGGNTTAANGTAGSITITGGNSTNTTSLNSGGAITITAGAGNSNQGTGGTVTINGGVGSSANGNGAVYIGNGAGSDSVSIGKSGASVSIPGNLSFDGSSNQLTSINAPGVLAISAGNLYLNYAGSTGLNTQGQLAYSSDGFKGWQTSTGSGRIPVIHSVFSQANSSTSTNTVQSVFASANDVLSSLEPNKLYRFSAKYYSSFTYAGTSGQIQAIFAFSNAAQSARWSYKTWLQTSGISSMHQVGTSSGTAAITATLAANTILVTELDGYFVTHATLASTFTPQFNCTAATSSSAVMQAGSWFEIEKLGTASQTLIAGNWG